MKKLKRLNKSFDNSTQAIASISEEDLALINRYTLSVHKAENLYCFKAVLCDNEVDRDFEHFTKEALDKLAVLFLGKTFIADHNWKSENQKARIYKLEVEQTGQLNSLGEPYCRLVASCYMVNIEQNRGLIAEIDAGIKKEVSVGVAVKKRVCSICGTDRSEKRCEHWKGHIYQQKTCTFSLEEPQDAYEVSFVAIPAQRNAGTTKQFQEDSLQAQVYRLKIQILNT